MNKSKLDDLKASWVEDPCWDIEETEGFEDYRDELRSFRIQMEAKWAREHMARVNAKARKLQVSYALAEHIMALEARIEALSSAVRRIAQP